MATTITGDGNYLVVTTDSIPLISIPKGKVLTRVDGNYLEIDHDGSYSTRLLYSDVSNPSTASAELLRVAVKNILNT